MNWPPPSPHVFTLEGGPVVVLSLNGSNWDLWYISEHVVIEGTVDDWETSSNADGTGVLSMFMQGPAGSFDFVTHVTRDDGAASH